MAAGNEVSRSSGGPIGDFPLNPPWQEEEKMKPAAETKPDMWKLADKFAALGKSGSDNDEPITRKWITDNYKWSSYGTNSLYSEMVNEGIELGWNEHGMFLDVHITNEGRKMVACSLLRSVANRKQFRQLTEAMGIKAICTE